jgi:hypothetical protein
MVRLVALGVIGIDVAILLPFFLMFKMNQTDDVIHELSLLLLREIAINYKYKVRFFKISTDR